MAKYIHLSSCTQHFPYFRNRRTGEQRPYLIPYSQLVGNPRREHTVTFFWKCQHLTHIRTRFALYVESNIKLPLGREILLFQMNWKLDEKGCDCGCHATRPDTASLLYQCELWPNSVNGPGILWCCFCWKQKKTSFQNFTWSKISVRMFSHVKWSRIFQSDIHVNT